MGNSENPHPFDALQPDFILDAIESTGLSCDGRVIALNSYENRVYQIGVEGEAENSQPVIAKFYRPQRWSNQQIQEEHDYCFELVEAELPVVAPIQNEHKVSLFEYGDFRFSLYPRKGGRAPELDDLENLFVLGRFLGRIHLIGASRSYKYRPTINSQTYGHESVEFLQKNFIPTDLLDNYKSITQLLLEQIDSVIDNAQDISLIRVHGDCHIGNMLWRDELPHFIDFDDSRMAPAIQDIWMLLSGSQHEQRIQLAEIIEGYNEFADFDLQELKLIEALRTLRMLHFSAWLAKRWDDPAFPLGFPWFNTNKYWEEHIVSLQDQYLLLQEPSIAIHP